jgi:hypothetical protein
MLYVDVSEHCPTFIGRSVPAYEDGTVFENSGYKIQTPGNYSEESIQHLKHGESMKSRIKLCSSCGEDME